VTEPQQLDADGVFAQLVVVTPVAARIAVLSALKRRGAQMGDPER